MSLSDDPNPFPKKWTESTFFVRVKGGAFCLLCPDYQNLLKSSKKYAFERHYKSKHQSIYHELQSRAQRVAKLSILLSKPWEKYADEIKLSIQKADQISELQVKKKMVGFVLAHKIVRNSKPFKDGEFLKDCLSSVVSLLCPELESKINEITLSRRMIGRKITIINAYLKTRLKEQIANSQFYAIALDESTDVEDISQLCIFIRGIDKNFAIFEELLSVVPMRDSSTGKDIFDAFMTCVDEFGINLRRLMSVTTDGCPSMVGKHVGFVQLLRNEAKKQYPQHDITALHCIIHQQALCKNSIKLNSVTDIVTRFVNYIRGSALRHRRFKSFLKNKKAKYGDVFYHNHVRWLSIGKVVERVYELREEIVEYLKIIKNYQFPQFECDIWLNDLAFAADFLGYLNDLNVMLQGNEQFAYALYARVDSFIDRLSSLRMDMLSNVIDEFPKLLIRAEYITRDQYSKYAVALSDLQNDMRSRFQDFKSLEFLFQCTDNLFHVNLSTPVPELPTDTYIAGAIEQYRLIQNNDELRAKYDVMSRIEFFNSLKRDHFNLVKYCSSVCLVMFASTYKCESLFSRMNNNKSVTRSSLNSASLDAIMRICSSSINIDFAEIARECNIPP